MRLAAVVLLGCVCIRPSFAAWLAEYFDNKNLSGTPVCSTYEEIISFDKEALIAISSQYDTFSSRWTGIVVPKSSGDHKIRVFTDDGSRVYVDGKLVIDKWYDQSSEHFQNVWLEANVPVEVKMEHYENHGAAWAILQWSPPAFEDGCSVEFIRANGDEIESSFPLTTQCGSPSGLHTCNREGEWLKNDLASGACAKIPRSEAYQGTPGKQAGCGKEEEADVCALNGQPHYWKDKLGENCDDMCEQLNTECHSAHEYDNDHCGSHFLKDLGCTTEILGANVNNLYHVVCFCKVPTVPTLATTRTTTLVCFNGWCAKQWAQRGDHWDEHEHHWEDDHYWDEHHEDDFNWAVFFIIMLLCVLVVIAVSVTAGICACYCMKCCCFQPPPGYSGGYPSGLGPATALPGPAVATVVGMPVAPATAQGQAAESNNAVY